MENTKEKTNIEASLVDLQSKHISIEEHVSRRIAELKSLYETNQQTIEFYMDKAKNQSRPDLPSHLAAMNTLLSVSRSYSERILELESMKKILKSEVNLKDVISYQRIEDWIVTAMEGGSNYWMEIRPDNRDTIRMTYKSLPEAKEEASFAEMVATLVWKYNLRIPIFDSEGGFHYLTKHSMLHGIHTMYLEDRPEFGEIMSPEDHGDAESADVFMQYAVLGDLVYG